MWLCLLAVAVLTVSLASADTTETLTEATTTTTTATTTIPATTHTNAPTPATTQAPGPTTAPAPPPAPETLTQAKKFGISTAVFVCCAVAWAAFTFVYAKVVDHCPCFKKDVVPPPPRVGTV